MTDAEKDQRAMQQAAERTPEERAAMMQAMGNRYHTPEEMARATRELGWLQANAYRPRETSPGKPLTRWQRLRYWAWRVLQP